MVKIVKKSNSTAPLLKPYAHKRNFTQTPEPDASVAKAKAEKTAPFIFVIHKHQASRLHYDLRLECEGILRSWAIPRGPSMDPLENRLSVRVEDHPLRYQEFEAVIPKGNYGAGTMMVWDRGTYTLYEDLPGETAQETFLRQYRKGSLKLEFQGQKVRGRFTLVKIKKSAGDDWLLIKKRDEFASSEDILEKDLSVHSGRSMQEITEGATAKKSKLIPEKKSPKQKSAIPRSLLKGCKKIPIPDHWRPMRPSKWTTGMAEKLPQKSWIYHLAPRGMLAVAIINDKDVQIKTATGLKLTTRCKEICQEFSEWPPGSIVTGIASLEKPYAVFHLGDILWLNKHQTASLSFQDRLALLQKLKLKDDGAIRALIQIDSPERVKGTVWQRSAQDAYEFATANETWYQLEGRGKSSEIVSSNTTHSILTNPSKIFWPEEGYTKKDLYDYYAAIADVMLPHLRDRPESLNRHPNGISGKSFYQKEVSGSVPGWMETTHISAYAGTKTVTQLLVQNSESLLYLVNMGCIEINTWLSHVPTIMTPDFAVIDIDPGSLGFEYVIQGAKIIQKLLDQLEAVSFCKTSGSRGIHIYLPTKNKDLSFAECQKFAELVGQYLVNKLPHLASTDRSPLKRRDKLYVDALQNRKGQTMASPYSVRPRPGATVSTPIAWKELTSKLDPMKFTIKTVPQRVAKIGDLWADMFKQTNDIKKLITRLEDTHNRSK